MGRTSEDYYDDEFEPDYEEDQIQEEVYQEAAQKIIENYMQTWQAIHGFDETSEEYMQEFMNITDQVYQNLNNIQVPEAFDYEIAAVSALLNNEIGNCPFEQSHKLNKLYNIKHINNKDDLCLIHAVKYQIEQSELEEEQKDMKLQRLQQLIEEINNNPELFQFANEQEYLTRVSAIIKMNIRVYSDFQCKQLNKNYRDFNTLGASKEKKLHVFYSDKKQKNDQNFQDSFQAFTDFTSSNKFKKTVNLYKVSQFSSKYGTRFHYEALESFNSSHSIQVIGSTVKVFKVLNTKTPNKYKLEQQLQIQINQLNEIQETQKQHEQDTIRHQNLNIANKLNMEGYCNQLKEKIRLYSQTTTSKLFVASFDFETIIKRGQAQIYSFSFVIIERSKDRSNLDNYLTFFEINHEPNNKTKQEELEKKILLIMQALEAYLAPEAVLTYTFNGKKFDHVLLLEIIHKFKMTDFLIETSIGDNGQRINKQSSVKIVNGGIQKMSFLSKFHILDIKLILGLGTLKKQCENFKVTTPKLQFNHYEVQEYFDQNNNLYFKPLLDKSIEDYNNIDCISVLQIHEKLENELLSAINATYENDFIAQKSHEILTDKIMQGSFFTCGQISLAVQEASQKHNMQDLNNNKYKQEKFEFQKKENKYSYEDYKWIRQSCVGGRTQAFNPGVYNTQITGQDFVSLYPSVQLDENNFYPCGEIQQFFGKDAQRQYKKQVLEDGKLAIIEITLQEQTSTHCIFAIRENGKLNWTSKTPNQNITVTSVELNKAIELGYKFKYVRCMIWQSMISGSTLFRTLQMFFNKKQQQDLNLHNDKINKTDTTNHAMRQIMKIICNSLYGKMMQKIHETTQEYVDQKQVINQQKIKNVKSLGHNMLQQEIFMDEKQIKRQMKEVWIASFVYSYARLKLFNCYLDEDLAQKGFRPLYCDTDSCFYDYKYYDIVKKNANKHYQGIWYQKTETQIVAQLGQLTQELQYDGKDYVNSKAVIIAPKFYVFLKQNHKELKNKIYYKKGAKGMDYAKDIIITPEIQTQLDEAVKNSENIQETLRLFMLDQIKNNILQGAWRQDESTYYEQFEAKQINYLIEQQEKGNKSINILTQRLLTVLVEKELMQKSLKPCSINNIVMIKNIKFDV